MKHMNSVVILTLASLALAFQGCTKPSQRTAAQGLRYEELPGSVPAEFSDAEKWNRPDICPEGATLSPLIRYRYDSGQPNHGFKHYFGRSCNLVTARDGETEPRKPASPETSAAALSSKALVTLQPHGPFIWWYENGKRMGAGTFDHGTLAEDWSLWEPDGSLAAK